MDPSAGDDGAEGLFGMMIEGTPDGYADCAAYYVNAPVDLDGVQDTYGLRPLTPALVLALDPAVTLEQLGDTVAAIGYPRAE